ncbi:2-aminoethylphosphonate--pyruvate transaminase [bacterium MnTg02]|nr:2-aminoethylphosphonate--pyruvate transaminase [bacterium MnTg02]
MSVKQALVESEGRMETTDGEPFLLTPGPLTTSRRVKEAMLRDWGSWDRDFNEVTADIRRRLVTMCGGDEDYQCVPMQGSGTFSVEAMLANFLPRDGRTLVLMNGTYGQRAARTLDYLGRDYVVLDKGDYLPPKADEVDDILSRNPAITDVFAVHCETSSGILNPLKDISDAVHKRERRLIVDAMSSFGAIPLDVADVPFEAMVSSANKCIEGVPGFGFVIAKTSALENSKGRSHSLSLDVYDQWSYMNRTEQWRFTPPTHTVVAFREALLQHEAEGGVPGRLARYSRNRDVLVDGMRAMGFRTLLNDEWLSPIIVTFFSPADPRFEFKRFYDEIKARGFIIYPGKLTKAESFRIGCIGYIDEFVMRDLHEAIRNSLAAMGVTDCRPAIG